MDKWFISLLNISISASWLVLAVVVLRFLLKKAPKWLNPLLWGIVALRLLFPVSIESVLSLLPSAQPIPPDIAYAARPAVDAGIPTVNDTVNRALTAAAPVTGASVNPLQIWLNIAGILWAIGVAAMLLYTLVSYLRLRRRVRDAARVEKNIYRSRAVDSPFVLGLFRPRIYLPMATPEEEAFYIVAHEKAHLRRRDHWWKPLGFTLLALHWFNPLMWLAYILLCRDIELACDEKVIRQLGHEGRADYSQALLSATIRRRSIAACPLAFGEVGVKQRVKNVLNYKKPGFWIIAAAVVSCIVLAVCFLTNPISHEQLTLEDVRRLAQKGEKLSWSDFEDFTYEEGIDPDLPDGNYVRFYKIEDSSLSVKICCPSKQERTPFAIMLCCSEEEYASMDMQTDDLETFISVHRRPLEPGQTNHWGVRLDVAGATAEDGQLSILWKELPEGVRLQFSGKHDLETEVNGEWVRMQPLPGKDWDMDVYNFLLQDIYSQNWGDIYGSLPDGHYRIGRGVQVKHDHKTRENFTVYGEFALAPSNPWGLMLSVEKASNTSATVVFHGPGYFEDKELLGGNDYILQKNVDGVWEDVPVLTEPTFAEKAYMIDINRRHFLSWEWLYGSLDAGHYRIGKEVMLWTGPTPAITSDVYGQTESGMAYGEFYLEEPDTGAVTMTVEPDFAYAVVRYQLAESAPQADYYLRNGYTLEKKEGEHWQKVKDLDLHWSEEEDPINFQWFQDPRSGMCILWDQFGDLTDGTYRLKKEVSVGKSEDARRFSVYGEFTVDASTAPFGYRPLEALPEWYNLEQAGIDGCVTMWNGDLQTGEALLTAFQSDCFEGKEAFLRFATCFSAGGESRLYIHDLSYDGSLYTLRWLENGQETVRTYRYLKSFEGLKPKNPAILARYRATVLTNDENLGFEDFYPEPGDIRSGVDMAHEVVFCQRTDLPDHPEVPQLEYTKAALTYEGQELVTLTYRDKLRELENYFRKAKKIGYEPATHSVGVGLELVFTTDAGHRWVVELDPDNNICRIDGEFCQYGQVEQPNVEKLWALLGITQWPEAVYETCLNAYRPMEN